MERRGHEVGDVRSDDTARYAAMRACRSSLRLSLPSSVSEQTHAADAPRVSTAWLCGERPSRTLRAVKDGGLRPSLTATRRNALGWAGRGEGMVLQSNKGMDAWFREPK